MSAFNLTLEIVTERTRMTRVAASMAVRACGDGGWDGDQNSESPEDANNECIYNPSGPHAVFLTAAASAPVTRRGAHCGRPRSRWMAEFAAESMGISNAGLARRARRRQRATVVGRGN